MKESFFRQLAAYTASEKEPISYFRAFGLSPAVYFSAYEDSECYSPAFLTLMPGISVALNEKTKTELTADNFHLEKIATPESIKTFFSKGSDNNVPDAALVDLLQTYTITCKTAEQSFEKVILLIDLNVLQFSYADAGILQAEGLPPTAAAYYTDSFYSRKRSVKSPFTNEAHTKFQLDSTLVMSTVLFPGSEGHMTLTICPDQYLEEREKSLIEP